MLEDFNEEAKKAPKPKEVMIKGNSRIFEYSQGELLNKLKNLDNMSEQEAYELLREEYSGILSDIFKRNSNDYKFLLNSTKFLTILTQVVNEVELQYDERVHCNSFIYRYIVYSDNESYVKKLLFMLGEAINKNTVRSLVGLELDERLAIFIAVAAKSSFEQSMNIRRLNFTLATALPSVMNSKMLISIYQILFTRITDLVITTVFDLDIQKSSDKEWVTQEILDVDARITYTVLVLLESMVPIEITRTLIELAEAFRLQYGTDASKSRVKFNELDKRVFNKVSIIVEQLEGDNYVFP